MSKRFRTPYARRHWFERMRPRGRQRQQVKSDLAAARRLWREGR